MGDVHGGWHLAGLWCDAPRCLQLPVTKAREASEGIWDRQLQGLAREAGKMRACPRSQDKALQRTAEIVMVLAGMAQLRAGKPPGTTERRLAARAFRSLSVLAECVAPEHLLSDKAVETLIRDLGLGNECQAIGDLKPAKRGVERFDPASSTRLSDEDSPESSSSGGDQTDCSSDLAHDMWSEDYNDDEARSSGNTSLHVGMLSAAEAGGLGTYRNHAGALSEFLGHARSETAPVFGLPAEASLVLGQEAYRNQLWQAVHQYVVQKMSSARARPTVVSTSFMRPPISCEMCQRVAKDAASVLICDSCDCAYHVACLLNFNARAFAKGDWVCPRCVILHRGRPQPPQYGPMRIPHHAHKSRHGHVAGRSLVPISHATVTSIGTSFGGRSPMTGETVRYLQIDHKLLNAAQRELEVVDTEFPSSQVCGKVEPKSRDPRKQGNEACSPVHTIVRNSSTCSTGQTMVQTTSSNVGQEGGLWPEVRAQGTEHPYSTVALLDAQSKGVYGGDTVRAEAEEGAASRCATAEIPSRAEQGEAGFGAPEKVADASIIIDLRAQEEGSGDDPDVMVWVGKVLHEVKGRVYYGACRVGKHVFKQDDFALFQPESTTVVPYIARLESLWEDTVQGSKWARVSWCYYPSDIPVHIVRPSEPEHDEVYESNHCDDNLLASIQGPCQVLHHIPYCAEQQRRAEAVKKGGVPSGDLCPIFVCRWLYDALTQTFEAVVEEEPSSE